MMSEYDMSIHSELFKKTFPAASEELILTWFANAMMAMHDHLQNGRIAELEQQLAKSRNTAIRNVENAAFWRKKYQSIAHEDVRGLLGDCRDDMADIVRRIDALLGKRSE